MSLLVIFLRVSSSVAVLVVPCRHRHELYDRVNGSSVLRCADCHRVRRNILAAVTPAYHRTYEAKKLYCEQEIIFQRYERQCAGERVRKKFSAEL